MNNSLYLWARIKNVFSSNAIFTLVVSWLSCSNSYSLFFQTNPWITADSINLCNLENCNANCILASLEDGNLTKLLMPSFSKISFILSKIKLMVFKFFSSLSTNTPNILFPEYSSNAELIFRSIVCGYR